MADCHACDKGAPPSTAEPLWSWEKRSGGTGSGSGSSVCWEAFEPQWVCVCVSMMERV